MISWVLYLSSKVLDFKIMHVNVCMIYRCCTRAVLTPALKQRMIKRRRNYRIFDEREHACFVENSLPLIIISLQGISFSFPILSNKCLMTNISEITAFYKCQFSFLSATLGNHRILRLSQQIIVRRNSNRFYQFRKHPEIHDVFCQMLSFKFE